MTGSPALYGQSVTVACNTGYRLVGKSSIPCSGNCTYQSNNVTCVPVECPAPMVQPGNATAVPVMQYGEQLQIRCNEGFKAASSPVMFGTPCATSITARCNADGTTSLSDRCVPVTCPSYDPSHHTLRCTDPSVCYDRSVVGRMVPSAPTRFGDKVLKVCNAGYVLSSISNSSDNPPTEYAVCSRTCQYTENQQACVPDTCAGFNPVYGCIINRPANQICNSNATRDPPTVSSTSAPYLGNITLSCGAGGDSYGQTVLTKSTWANCGTQASSTCNMNKPVLVYNGTAQPDGANSVSVSPPIGPRSVPDETSHQRHAHAVHASRGTRGVKHPSAILPS